MGNHVHHRLCDRLAWGYRKSSAWVSQIKPRTSDLTPPPSHPHTSHLTPHFSPLAPHTSHLRPSQLAPHTSGIAPHISQLTPHSSPLTPDNSYLTDDISHSTAHLPEQCGRILHTNRDNPLSSRCCRKLRCRPTQPGTQHEKLGMGAFKWCKSPWLSRLEAAPWPFFKSAHSFAQHGHSTPASLKAFFLSVRGRTAGLQVFPSLRSP